jgi:hypothetical protein
MYITPPHVGPQLTQPFFYILEFTRDSKIEHTAYFKYLCSRYAIGAKARRRAGWVTDNPSLTCCRKNKCSRQWVMVMVMVMEWF